MVFGLAELSAALAKLCDLDLPLAYIEDALRAALELDGGTVIRERTPCAAVVIKGRLSAMRFAPALYLDRLPVGAGDLGRAI